MERPQTIPVSVISGTSDIQTTYKKGASAVVNASTPQTVSVTANTKVSLSSTSNFVLAVANTTASITDVATVVSKNGNTLVFKEFQSDIQGNAFSIGIDVTPNFGGSGSATLVFELYSLASASVVRSQVLTLTSNIPTGYTSLPHTLQFFPVSDAGSFASGYEVRVICDKAFTYSVKKVVRNTFAQ